MDISSGMGGNPPDQEQKPPIEYEAQAVSPIIKGEAKLTIDENALIVAALFDTAEIPYARISAIRLTDYAVTVFTDSGDYVFSRMGSWCLPFHDALCAAYNNAVLRSLFVEGRPILTASGDYRYTENGKTVSGTAPVHVYENCLVVLPPDLKARRIPLCFAGGINKDGYSLTLELDTGESYTFSRLGYDTAPFAGAVEKQIRMLREKAHTAIRELDPSLTTAQASRLAGLMPVGAAAPLGRVESIAPSFTAALEAKIMETRAAESYKAFKALCAPATIWAGFRKNITSEGVGPVGGMGALPGNLSGGDNPLAALGGLTGGAAPAEGEEAILPDPYLLWLIVPSPDGQRAAVEFMQADSATFVYRTGGDFDRFARQLNRALEAIRFRREVIRLTDAELRKPDNADCYMAAKRTAALQFVRASFAGRVIHANPGAWKKKLLELWSATP